ncbi:general substrate transporter [Hesseltinella vesiculosa]|uniref:General substrate transporter n=1 Tax=Hesseltinella vesiculosa TaxID=101127 RepID=A0A1X2GSE8_9FUNG|nr:general substrate transporter [Hesseltinella vesiculosa]
MKGDIVAMLQVGCCVGSIATNLVAEPIGRKKAIIIFAAIFIMGGIMQVAAQNLATMKAGRFFAGLGVGACSALVPMYIAETAPRKMRGRLGTTWQFLIVLGIMVSYFIDYGAKIHLTGTNQWRVPLGIQIVPGGILLIGMFFLPESLRWLAVKGQDDRVKQNLLKLRGCTESDAAFQQEYHEILEGAAADRDKDVFQLWKSLFTKNNLRRLGLGIMLQVFQQWTGTNAVNYYAPEIFQSSGLNTNNIDLIATGVYGVVKVAFVFVSFFMVDTRLGRRRTLMIGSVVMFTAFFVLAGLIYGIQKENGGNLGTGVQAGAKGYAAMVMIYLFAVGYEFSWGPIPWICCSEIFPNNIRSLSLSITTAFNWACNAVIAKVTPLMMTNITYGTYFFFGSMAVVMGVFVYFFLPETRGRSMEELNVLLDSGKVFVHNDQYVIDHERLERDAEAGDYKE